MKIYTKEFCDSVILLSLKGCVLLTSKAHFHWDIFRAFENQLQAY